MESKHTFSLTECTAIYKESTYLWVAFNVSGGICHLYKLDAYDLTNLFFDISVTATKITGIIDTGSYIYCSLDDVTNIGIRISKTNPLVDYTYIPIPAGITEEAVGVTYDATKLYFLTPGLISGTNAKVVVFTLSSLAYSETVTLTSITDARKIDRNTSPITVLYITSLNDPPTLTAAYKIITWTITSGSLT